MAEFELQADVRSGHGKGAVRRLRRTGRIPAIMYGAGQDPLPLDLAENVLRRQLSNEAWFSHVLTVKVDGREEKAVIKSLQRHPATERILHLDLLRVSETQKITMLVPIHFENEEDSPGRRAGGSISHHMTEVEISCLPGDLPEYLAVNTVDMDIGDSIHLSQVPLPEGVEVPALIHGSEHDQPVISIQVSRVTEVEEVTEAGEDFELPETPEAGADGGSESPSGADG
ncbi:MAG: 50S ribosomal protein L25/general stress protein Ctc [Immundisolibacterales bacterium]|nr:50S ribosomal protein L25/general stress protein Ctc [Immundisolibacterales bacterium]